MPQKKKKESFQSGSLLLLILVIAAYYVIGPGTSPEQKATDARLKEKLNKTLEKKYNHAKVGETLITTEEARLCSSTSKCIEGLQLITKIPPKTKLVIEKYNITPFSGQWYTVHYRVTFKSKTGWVLDSYTNKAH